MQLMKKTKELKLEADIYLQLQIDCKVMEMVELVFLEISCLWTLAPIHSPELISEEKILNRKISKTILFKKYAKIE